MKVLHKGDVLELVDTKGRLELVLGWTLFVFAIFFLIGVPVAYTQHWSYRFGAVSGAERILGAAFSACMCLVCLAGAYFFLIVRNLYRFDRSSKTFMLNALAHRMADIAGVLVSRKQTPSGTRCWVGVRFINGETLYFAEQFESEAEARGIVSVISEHTGLRWLLES